MIQNIGNPFANFSWKFRSARSEYTPPDIIVARMRVWGQVDFFRTDVLRTLRSLMLMCDMCGVQVLGR